MTKAHEAFLRRRAKRDIVAIRDMIKEEMKAHIARVTIDYFMPSIPYVFPKPFAPYYPPYVPYGGDGPWHPGSGTVIMGSNSVGSDMQSWN